MGQVCDSADPQAGKAAVFARARESERNRRDRGSLLRQIRALEAEVDGLRALAGLGEKVAGVAHGWKNAVHTLRGFTALLQGRIGVEPGAAAVLDGLRGAIDQLEENARDLLNPDTARPPRGQTGLLNSRQTASIIGDALGEVAHSFPGLRPSRCGVGRIPPLPVPGKVLREALHNVLLNAAEAGSARITVTTATVSGVFLIEVRDDGPGIPPGELLEVFRAGHTTKPLGSGFGLFLSRSALRSFGADLLARNAEGGGASFLIRVPAGRVQADGPGPAEKGTFRAAGR